MFIYNVCEEKEHFLFSTTAGADFRNLSTSVTRMQQAFI